VVNAICYRDQQHGYKGALEVAATVDYLFGYDATAQVVKRGGDAGRETLRAA
jgi:cobalamin biosynthesis Mg chelatase CobN